MDYIVFDLEWNQSSDGQEKEIKEIPFEIIVIGKIFSGSDGRIFRLVWRRLYFLYMGSS